MAPQEIHDELLAMMPADADHHCDLCQGTTTTTARQKADKEGDVADDRTFTEKEHAAILERAVEEAVEKALADAKTRNGELENQVDALEASVEAEKARATAAEKALEDEKERVIQEKAAEERAQVRVEMARKVAPHLSDEYIQDRRDRWAGLPDEQWSDMVEMLAETAVAALPADDAAQLDGLTGQARIDRLVAVNEARAKREENDDDGDDGAGSFPFRATAAFTGGVTPTDKKDKGKPGVSPILQLLSGPAADAVSADS